MCNTINTLYFQNRFVFYLSVFLSSLMNPLEQLHKKHQVEEEVPTFAGQAVMIEYFYSISSVIVPLVMILKQHHTQIVLKEKET